MTIRIPVDFSEVEDRPLIEKGVYDAVIEKLVYLEAASEDKFPQLQIAYTITDGEYKGQGISQYRSFSPKSAGFMKELTDALGITEWLTENDGFEIDEDTGVVIDPDLSGAVVQIKVEVQPHYQDKNRKVNKIERPPVLMAEEEEEKPKRVSPLKRGTSNRPGSRTIR